MYNTWLHLVLHILASQPCPCTHKWFNCNVYSALFRMKHIIAHFGGKYSNQSTLWHFHNIIIWLHTVMCFLSTVYEFPERCKGPSWNLLHMIVWDLLQWALQSVKVINNLVKRHGWRTSAYSCKFSLVPNPRRCTKLLATC